MVAVEREHERAGEPAGEVAFKAVGVKKHYPGVKALDGVDLEGYAGEVLAICGANGAGKSTFAKLLAGVETPTDGEITVTGYPHPVRNAAEAEQAGVLMMHQEPLIIDDFTVGENVWLYKLRERQGHPPVGAEGRHQQRRDPQVLRDVGLGHLRTNQLAGDLGPGQRQMLSLSRAAVTTHKIMILDETTASTSEEHFKDILDLVAREKAAGTSIIFVSHRLNEVFAMCDRIAVLRNGKLVDVAQGRRDRPRRDHHADDRPGPQGAGPARRRSTTDARQPVISVRDLYGGTAKGCLVRRQPGRDRRPLRAGRQRPVLGRPHHHRSEARPSAAPSRCTARRCSSTPRRRRSRRASPTSPRTAGSRASSRTSTTART